MRHDHPFEPIADEHSKVLILGSFPSIRSFENQFYYAHPSNQFWPIMEALFQRKFPDTEAKRHFALEQGIALWDVYGSVERSQGNSSDANLKEKQLNDIPTFAATLPELKAIFCTSKTALRDLLKTFPNLTTHYRVEYLPSPSALYASISIEQKREAYRVIRDYLG